MEAFISPSAIFTAIITLLAHTLDNESLLLGTVLTFSETNFLSFLITEDIMRLVLKIFDFNHYQVIISYISILDLGISKLVEIEASQVDIGVYLHC